MPPPAPTRRRRAGHEGALIGPLAWAIATAALAPCEARPRVHRLILERNWRGIERRVEPVGVHEQGESLILYRAILRLRAIGTAFDSGAGGAMSQANLAPQRRGRSPFRRRMNGPS